MTARSSHLKINPQRTLTQIDRILDREHFVQFFDTESELAEGVARFLSVGFAQGEVAAVIASGANRAAIERQLGAAGLNVSALQESGRYSPFDAREMLERFMVGRRPDAQRFRTVIGSWMNAQGGRRIRAFGEMVALLWADGNQKGAIELEQLWNKLGQDHEFTLYCAYPSSVGADLTRHESFMRVCREHSTVIGGAMSRPTWQPNLR